ncbi:class I SAM-dependent methyltransferase [Candidatus Woesearchaeota archaeon]|jgi:SAM-dependent methyltransferase|nr:class I SAM-dependent methyltransferase [Candidatus Woesearchaeota archaeon]MBT4114428.1 class I SAM-dependent methyltransferase [Candidatus Woesearchaeota archaeon]MBT4248291.1 class I SAM-dependent methyltransferase [Candidatus Woesearchaeota archaeon]
MKSKVKKYYTEYGEGEWKRLIKDPYHQMEFNTSMHFLKKYLPKKGLILDAGAGPGRYTVALAKQGYDVVLRDLTPKFVEMARKKVKYAGVSKRVKSLEIGDITNLSEFKDGTFDAVICLGGPLTHVVDKKQRERAAAELVRVAKKGSLVFVSLMTRFSIHIDALEDFQEEIVPLQRKIRDTGDYPGGKYGFAPSHFFMPEELDDLFKRKGLEVITLVGLEGLSTDRKKKVNKLYRTNKKAWDIWWETHLKTCTHPGAVGISSHMMIIGRKK